MDITEKAKEYAQGKALEAMTAAIEKAYADGFKDGYDDGLANRERPQSERKYENLSYVDLELPSGTKWTSGYLTYTDGTLALLKYDEARIFNLPTKEQYQELLDNTDQLLMNSDKFIGTIFVSKVNGAKLYIPKVKKSDNYVFWLRDIIEDFYKRLCVSGAYIQQINKAVEEPVVLVSK